MFLTSLTTLFPLRCVRIISSLIFFSTYLSSSILSLPKVSNASTMKGAIFRMSLMKSKAYSESGFSISLRSCTIFLRLSFTERAASTIFNFSSFSLYSQFSNVGLKKWQSLYQFIISCFAWYLLFTNTELISLSMANQFFVKSGYRYLRNGAVSRISPKAFLYSL